MKSAAKIQHIYEVTSLLSQFQFSKKTNNTVSFSYSKLFREESSRVSFRKWLKMISHHHRKHG